MSKVDETTESVAEEVKESADTVESVVETAQAAEAQEKPKSRRGRKPGSGKKAPEAEAKESGRKKPGRPSKKEAKEEKTGTEMILQLWGHDVDISKVEENIKAQFVADGHRAGNIKNLQAYIKPEENKAYFVINDGKFTGDVDLW